jgi:hypothetical protein
MQLQFVGCGDAFGSGGLFKIEQQRRPSWPLMIQTAMAINDCFTVLAGARPHIPAIKRPRQGLVRLHSLPGEEPLVQSWIGRTHIVSGAFDFYAVPSGRDSRTGYRW